MASALGMILPAFVSILIILLFLGKIEDNSYVIGAFEGIKAASAALILVAAYQMGKQVLKGKLSYFITVSAFAVIVLAGVNAIWVIVFGGLTGYLSYQYYRHSEKKKGGIK